MTKDNKDEFLKFQKIITINDDSFSTINDCMMRMVFYMHEHNKK